MASQRKTSSRAKAAKPAKKKAAHAGTARAKAKPGPARAAGRSARPAAHPHPRPHPASPGTRPGTRPGARAATGAAVKKAAPVAKGKPAPHTHVASPGARAVPALKKGAPVPKKKGAVAPPEKKVPTKLKAVARPPAAAPEVRPLGVLPPEARARGGERLPHGGAIGARPAVPRHPREAGREQEVERVTDQDMKEFEDRLMAERQRLMKEMGHLETTVLKVNPRDSAGDLSGYSFHMADAGTDAYEREKSFMFASTEGRLLMEINEALRRVYNGEYGVCESCGNPIGRARLEAMPYARLCRDCKEREERVRRREP